MNDYMPLSCTEELITPEIARKYLSLNSYNPRKKVNTHAVNGYAQDMKTGRWMRNGEPICFDTDGNLKDGQHRLRAVIQADTPVYMLVVRNVNTSCDLYDYGLKRDVGQELNCPYTVSAVAATIVSNGSSSSSSVPRKMMKDYIVDHMDDLCEAYRIARLGANHSICRKRDVVLGIYILIRNSNDVSSIITFCNVVNTGIPIDGHDCSAPLAFRRKLENWSNSRALPNVLLNLEYFLRAYNDFLNGVKRTKVYKLKSYDDAKHSFEYLRSVDGLGEVG